MLGLARLSSLMDDRRSCGSGRTLPPKPLDLYAAQKTALGVADIEMGPHAEIGSSDFLRTENLPDDMRVHPRFLMGYSHARETDKDHYVAYGLAEFSSDVPSIGDRTNHALPHVSGPDIEHACLNLVKIVGPDMGISAPLAQVVTKHYIEATPSDKPVLIEMHGIAQGELAGAEHFKKVGTILFFIRSMDTGKPIAEVLLQYRAN